MFTYETQGVTTYLVYKIKADDVVDTLSLGMLTNNNIFGFARVLYTQVDQDKYLKYNITAKVKASQFFAGVVNRSQLLGVFSSILGALISSEEYMIEKEALLEMEYIFVDVSSYEASLICLPVIADVQQNIDIKTFFKDIIFSTQFNQAENNSYVTEIINFLNSSTAVSLSAFKTLVDKLLLEAKAAPAQAPVVQAPVQQPSARPLQPPVPPQLQQQMPPQQMAPQPQQPPAKKGKKVKPAKPPKQPKEKFGFSFFGKSKKQKPAPAPNQQPQVQQIQVGFSVPGMGVQQPGAAQGAAQAQPPQPAPAPQPAAAPAPVPQQTATQPAPQPATVPAPAPVATQTAPSAVYQPASFGETTVLGAAGSGETTVLGGGEALPPQPYLLRAKTNEKIPLNKEMLRIGKERSYADYFIADNPSISRSHATIITRAGNCSIVDTNSTNHTYVNGQLIASNVEVPLENGAQVRLSNEEFTFYAY
ncbi:DUF6382 domain-containing protein [Ruminococcaceae bacterium OttesenSCG-928-A16]|nr:DUF6382 domain-containing protein [Ruminococcaceae bacterium OttesenSCG-928-A16]